MKEVNSKVNLHRRNTHPLNSPAPTFISLFFAQKAHNHRESTPTSTGCSLVATDVFVVSAVSVIRNLITDSTLNNTNVIVKSKPIHGRVFNFLASRVKIQFNNTVF